MATKTKKKTAFDLLTKAEKRVVILKDALKHLNAGRIIPDCGAVMRLPNVDYKVFGESLQNVLKSTVTTAEPCEVCQRGALLFATVWRNNNLTLEYNKIQTSLFSHSVLGGQAGGANQDDLFLRQFFSLRQLMLMERAFEGMYHIETLSKKQADAALNFHDQYSSNESRMEAILKNAIKNGGIFKP